jgi:hypothetical protein
MGIFDKLFGKKPAPAGPGGQISLMLVNLQQGREFKSQRCGSCGSTFACPGHTQTVITSDTSRFLLDIGGYCDTCREFRCPDHSQWLEVADMTHGIGCGRCGARLRGVG